MSWGKEINVRLVELFIAFLQQGLNDSIKQKHDRYMYYLSDDIKITLKSCFWYAKLKILQ